MTYLDEFLNLMTGSFNNESQFKKLKKVGIEYPYAEHINTICNDKIQNLPDNFTGKFLVEESYYTIGDQRRISSHLFLFTEEKNGIMLTSYEIPRNSEKSKFTYNSMKSIDFCELKKSEKFTPIIYRKKDSVWEGSSVSQFSPVMTFKLWERFSTECHEVSEIIEINGKRTFGCDEPIIYKRR